MWTSHSQFKKQKETKRYRSNKFMLEQAKNYSQGNQVFYIDKHGNKREFDMVTKMGKWYATEDDNYEEQIFEPYNAAQTLINLLTSESSSKIGKSLLNNKIKVRKYDENNDYKERKQLLLSANRDIKEIRKISRAIFKVLGKEETMKTYKKIAKMDLTKINVKNSRWEVRMVKLIDTMKPTQKKEFKSLINDIYKK